MSNTFKHLGSTHSQQDRHGWRYGGGEPSGKRKRRIEGQGKDEWSEFVRRSRGGAKRPVTASGKPAKPGKGVAGASVSKPRPKKTPPKKSRVQGLVDKKDGDFEDFAPKDVKGYMLAANQRKVNAGDKKMAAAYEGMAASLSPEQRSGILDYTNGHYEDINKSLRGAGSLTKAETAEAKMNVGRIDSAMNKSAAPFDFVSYRGYMPKKAHFDAMSKAKPGQVISDSAYASTSIDKGMFGSFRGNANSVSIRYRVPKGAKGLYVSTRKTKLAHSNVETEFLLPRGAKLYINKITRNKNGSLEFDVTVLP